ncbi:MAG TPA: PLP-dependent aminotransferase family protein [Candidatus Baltobacteraceae bacterium]|nr:PLP-dependent aminotransferase family protein [Candidatus Baltobacteraceae bacterium]
MAPTLARRAAQLRPPAHPSGGDAVSLDSGYAFAEIFPDFTAAAERALTAYRSEALQYGFLHGLPELREWIAAYMRADGAAVSANDILMVNGAKHGLDLLCRVFTEEGDAVVVTAPTYFTAIPILRGFGLTTIEIPQDEEGMDVAALQRRLTERDERGLSAPKFIYDVPDFHNPTGVTMSALRRQQILAVAAARNIAVIEDTPYRRLRFEGEPAPTLKSLDRTGLVFALGTFSKLLAPGLRLGWIAGNQSTLARAAQLKSDGGTSPLVQRIVLEFVKDGGLDAQVERARAAYAQHRDAMVHALRNDLPDVTFTVPHGGYYVWAKFPEGTDTDELARAAYDAGVSVIAGSAFYAGEPRKNYLRLAYSSATPEQIERGVKILAGAYRSRG